MKTPTFISVYDKVSIDIDIEPVSVITHDGIFHADEVMACAILLFVFPYIEVERTRDKEKIEEAKKDSNTIVIDVGQDYNEEMNNFDHHQKGGVIINNRNYASAGLIWKKFGKEIADEYIFNKIDKNVIKIIDDWDNGYKDTISPISAVVSMLNTSWNNSDPELEDERFHKAVLMCYELLLSNIEKYKDDKLVEDIVNSAEIIDDIMVLNKFAPWQTSVVNIPKYENIKFVVYPTKNDTWNIQAVPVVMNSRECRLLLPESWAGLSGKELDEVTGISDCVFCHNGRFIAGNKNKEGAIKMAKIALNN